MPYFYLDYWYIVLIVPCMILSLVIQVVLKSTYARYSRVYSKRGITADEVARRILRDNGLYNVSVMKTQGTLTDNYDPTDNTVHLSQGVYGNTSVAALGIACHEVGHALQYNSDYLPIKARNALVPVVNVSSRISWIVILVGLVAGSEVLASVGILLFSFATLFHLVTLPVEINASRRAIKILKQDRILDSEELKGTRKVLGAAAMTYVASLITSIASLLRILFIVRRRD